MINSSYMPLWKVRQIRKEENKSYYDNLKYIRAERIKDTIELNKYLGVLE